MEKEMRIHYISRNFGFFNVYSNNGKVIELETNKNR